MNTENTPENTPENPIENPITSKICTKCHKAKLLDQYNEKLSQPGVLNKYCNDCCRSLSQYRKRRMARTRLANPTSVFTEEQLQQIRDLAADAVIATGNADTKSADDTPSFNDTVAMFTKQQKQMYSSEFCRILNEAEQIVVNLKYHTFDEWVVRTRNAHGNQK
jgi:hypothetical protein